MAPVVASLPTRAVIRQKMTNRCDDKAIEALGNAMKENVRCEDCYLSPMADYFGEREGSLPDTLPAASPLANVTNSPTARASPKAGRFGGDLNHSSKKIQLPFKSPMSAYFDDGADWESIMSPSPKSRSSLSDSESPLFVSSSQSLTALRGRIPSSESCCSAAPSTGRNLVAWVAVSPCSPRTPCSAPPEFEAPPVNNSTQSASRQHEASRAQSTPKSALRLAPNIGSRLKERRVSWAEEAEVEEVEEAREKAPLRLIDLLSPTSQKSKSPLAQRVWKLSQDAQGTFEVQKALEECNNNEERAQLAAELHGHVVEATLCPHANHVLRKVITSTPPPALNFVIVELMVQGPGGIVDLARHRYGCRILEGLLSHCPLEQLCGMVETLVVESAQLSTHMYGNFVLQRLFEEAPGAVRCRVLHVVHANLVTMGTNFYGSTVVGKAMLHGSDAEKLLLARAIINVGGLLSAVSRYRHGKAIVELVMATLEGVDQAAAAHATQQLAAPPLKLPKSVRGC